MKTVLALTAALALVGSGVALAQSRPAPSSRGAPSYRPHLTGGVSAGAGYRAPTYGGQGYRAPVRVQEAYRGDGRYGRGFNGRRAFGIGVVTAGIASGYGSYDGYDAGPAYAPGYAYAPAYPDTPDYGSDDGQGYAPDYAYESNASPYIAGSYSGALQQQYETQGYSQAPAYDQAAPAYQGAVPAQAPPAGGRSCGQWTWDPTIGRYVWAC